MKTKTTNKGAPRVLCLGCGREAGNPIGPLSHVTRCEGCSPKPGQDPGLTITVLVADANGRAQSAQ